jgi:hypothetical protein
MNTIEFKNCLPADIVTHNDLLLVLHKYSKPNDKISQLVRNNILLPLKKGLYIVNKQLSGRSVNKKVIANILYGPSYISLEYALYEYGLIPEKVVNITSVTTGRKKIYKNELGIFSYLSLPRELYSVATTWKNDNSKECYLIAKPEKALCDKIYLDKTAKISSVKQLGIYLEQDLRIDSDDLLKLNLKTLKILESRFAHSKITLLLKLIEKMTSGDNK